MDWAEFISAHGEVIAGVIAAVLGTGLGLRGALALLFERLNESPEALAFWQRVFYRLLPRSVRLFINRVTDESAEG